MAAPRPWGYWTEGKLDMLSEYLHGFALASQRYHSTYLDLFAGQAENTIVDTERNIAGSLLRALGTTPPLTLVRGFELRRDRAQSLQAACVTEHPGRNVAVIPGDVHEKLAATLRSLRHYNTCPTFAFVDPDGIEARWSLLETLAAFKAPAQGRGVDEIRKTELFVLMSAPAVFRVVHDRLDADPREHAEKTVSDLFGCDDWRPIHQARQRGRIDPARARDELTNLFRWRLERVLGYRYTHTLRVTNVGGVALYDLIFATDHPAGHKIMSSVYGRAIMRFPQMQTEAQARRRDRKDYEAGQDGLFSMLDLASSGPIDAPMPKYDHLPPVPPFGERQEGAAEDSGGADLTSL